MRLILMMKGFRVGNSLQLRIDNYININRCNNYAKHANYGYHYFYNNKGKDTDQNENKNLISIQINNKLMFKSTL